MLGHNSAGAYTSARAEVRSVDGLAPHPVPTSLRMSALRVMTLSLQDMLSVGECPVKLDTKVSGCRLEVYTPCIDVHIQLTFHFLVVQMEDC